MQQIFTFERTAVLVEAWADEAECGARVEVRMLDDEPRRGTRTSAQRVVLDRLVWRADLLDRVGGPPANLERAHFHPKCVGHSAGDRIYDETLQRDPAGWLQARLGHLEEILDEAGVLLVGVAAPWVESDAAELRAALPSVLQAVEAALTSGRAS